MKISSLSVINNNSIVMTASLLNESGEIVNRDLEKQATFFGYLKDEYSKIKNCEELMPHWIGVNH